MIQQKSEEVLVKTPNSLSRITTRTNTRHLCKTLELKKVHFRFAGALQLNLATALEDLRVAIGGKAKGSQNPTGA